MNPEQWSGTIRIIVTALLAPSSYLVAKGIVPADQAPLLIPAIVTVVTAGGSSIVGYFTHRSHSAAAITAAVNSGSAPGVKVVPTSSPTPAVAIAPSGAIVPGQAK